MKVQIFADEHVIDEGSYLRADTEGIQIRSDWYYFAHGDEDNASVRGYSNKVFHWIFKENS